MLTDVERVFAATNVLFPCSVRYAEDFSISSVQSFWPGLSHHRDIMTS